jgi:hypothetical protein
MLPKRQPENEPELVRGASEVFTEPYAEAQELGKLFFYLLPNYQVDRRYDKYVRQSTGITLPHTDDYQEKFNLIASPGDYWVELRRGRKITGDGWMLSVPPRVRVAEPSPQPQPAPPLLGQLDELAARLERIERVLLEGATVERDDDSLARRRRLRRRPVRRMRESESQPQQTTLDIYRESVERERILYQQLISAKASQVQTLDEDDRGLTYILKNPSIKNKIQSAVAEFIDVEPPDWKTELVRGLVDQSAQIIPAVQTMIAQQISPPSDGNAQAAANGHQQVQSAPVDPVQQTLSIIVNDLKRNRRVGRAADSVEDLYLKRPDSEAQIAPLLALPAAGLIAQLSQFAGNDLTTYSHAVAWIEDLQAELSPDEDLEADEASEADEDLPEPVVSQDELR